MASLAWVLVMPVAKTIDLLDRCHRTVGEVERVARVEWVAASLVSQNRDVVLPVTYAYVLPVLYALEPLCQVAKVEV